MYEIGDEVVIMSAPGRWKIVAIEGDVLTIENSAGIRKQVLGQAVRKLEERAS